MLLLLSSLSLAFAAIVTQELTYTDRQRDREVSVHMFYDSALANCQARSVPLVLFSHGLLGEWDMYNYLAAAIVGQSMIFGSLEDYQGLDIRFVCTLLTLP